MMELYTTDLLAFPQATGITSVSHSSALAVGSSLRIERGGGQGRYYKIYVLGCYNAIVMYQKQ
jgi:hypothetical protein